LLIVDHQVGLLQLVRDYEVSEFRKVSPRHDNISSGFQLTQLLVCAEISSITACRTDASSNVLAHAEIGKVFNLKVVMTTSAETGI
jgi:hypothetical protein